MGRYIAGHWMDEIAGKRRCRDCGRLWVDIRNTAHADIGKPNIAHTGDLNHLEATQIMEEAKREDEAIHAATFDAVRQGRGSRPALEQV